MLQKIKNTIVQIITLNEPPFKIIGINKQPDNSILFDIQIVGKNFCYKYSRDQLLKNKFIYDGLSDKDKKLVNNQDILSDNNEMQTRKSIVEVLKIKKYSIKSVTIDRKNMKKIFSLQMESDNHQETYYLTAADILKNKKILDFLSTSEKLEVAFSAGAEYITDEFAILKKEKTKNTTSDKQSWNE